MSVRTETDSSKLGVPSNWHDRSGPFAKITVGLLVFFGTCVVAALGYIAAGWQPADAIYMVVITIFGVGYGEVQPIDSVSLRTLTIALIVFGYGAVIYTVGGFMQMLIDGELNAALGARRMTKDIENLSGHTIICGLGRLGSTLAAELKSAGKGFVAIDADETRIKHAESLGYRFIQGDATEEETLSRAGIDRASMVAAVLSEDAINVFVTITARGMNPQITIVARGENPRTEKKLLGCGANQVVLPTAIGAQKVAQLVLRPTAENLLEEISAQSLLGDELERIGLCFDELNVQSQSDIVNRPIEEIEIRSNHGFLIVGIRRKDGTKLINPPPETTLAAGDVVVVLGHQDDLPMLARTFSKKKQEIMYRGARLVE